MVAIGAAVGAATAYALASVLQQRAAASQPHALSMRAGLLVRLFSQRTWLLGVGADVVGFVLQFIALGLGTLAVVQPLLVSGLLIALPLGAWLSHRRLQPSEWRGAIYVVVGLAVFLAAARPESGRADATGAAWIAVSLATLLPAFALAMIGVRATGRMRAGVLAAATGTVYAYTAALTKTSGHLLGGGIGALLTAWQPYALAFCGAAGMLLAQSAFQAAPLDASLPLLTVIDPVVSVAIGALAFHESMSNSPPAIGLQVAAIGLLTVGVFRLGGTTELAL